MSGSFKRNFKRALLAGVCWLPNINYKYWKLCTHANTSQVETENYLIKENYGILILRNIKNCLTNA